MAIYDISVPVSESLVVWPGQPKVVLTTVSSIKRGDHATVTQFSMSAHTGTHVDAPCHFISGGSGVDTLRLDVLVGPAYVADVGQADAITAEVLDGLNIPAGTTRLLVRTRNSELWKRSGSTFFEDYVAFSEDGAAWLIGHGVQLVGIDYLSVAPYRNTQPAHLALLGARIVLLETLDLRGIDVGMYDLVCLPLNIVGSDGAPARAILMDHAA